jgi:hypothetical protein
MVVHGVPNGNGNGLGRALVAAALGGLCTLAVGAWGSAITTINSNRERIAVLETEFRDIASRLERIEAKLDKANHPRIPLASK